MGQLPIYLLTVVYVSLAYYIWQYHQYKSLAKANGCKEAKKFPHKDPFLGIDHFLQAGNLFDENRYLPELVERYKENGRTFQTNLFGIPSINSTEPENLKAVFSSCFQDWGVQPIRLPAQGPFCGRGFITTDGTAWEHSRSLLKPSFRKENIADLSILEHYLQKVIERIPGDGSTVDLQPLFFSLVCLLAYPLYLDTATLFLFGESFDSLADSTSDEAEKFQEAFKFAMFGSGFRIALGPFKWLWRNSKWREACSITHRFADRYVQKAIDYRQDLQLGLIPQRGTDEASPKRQQKNLLYNMAEQTDDRTTLRNELLQALMAAQETTAVLISNTFFLLARHPDVWNRLRQDALALTEDQAKNMDALLHIKYLRNVLNESLRLYPIFPQMNRGALTPTILPTGGGPHGNSPIYCPKGTIFDTAYYVLHRDPTIWGPDAL
ncbi:MAG: hypothetical protein Q9222_007855, partial [Ikaeria aurantiellina]